MRFTREDEWLVPIRAVCCPFCEHWVPVDALTAMETMWMHEYDCEAIALDYEMQKAA
jgi:formate hydrogenlyase subunit 6/NADH:ubiquinone oxidoreductase subunit I